MKYIAEQLIKAPEGTEVTFKMREGVLIVSVFQVAQDGSNDIVKRARYRVTKMDILTANVDVVERAVKQCFAIFNGEEVDSVTAITSLLADIKERNAADNGK